MRHTPKGRLAALFLVLSLAALQGAGAPSSGRKADQDFLKPFGALVGDWRGVGQPERGKMRGAWTESANWAWKLSKETAALEVTVAKGKYLKSGVLHPDSDHQTYELDATLADGSKRVFTGKPDPSKKKLILNAAKGEGLRRITIAPLHDTRLIVQLEALDPDGRTYYQLGEIGYTRQGVAFAVGESGPLCIVTEGRGTIQVSYKGKSYWVCCSGCKDLFNENPEAVLAEAADRQKAKDKK
jgi:YHS domain-containing protein